jgi:hypothetical protein
MLTQRQTEEFARRIASLFNGNNPIVHGYQAYGGWFPHNIDEVLAEVLTEVSPNEGTYRVAVGHVAPARSLMPVITGSYNDSTRRYEFTYDSRQLHGDPDFNRSTGVLTVQGQVSRLPSGLVCRNDEDIRAWRASSNSTEIVVSVPVTLA